MSKHTELLKLSIKDKERRVQAQALQESANTTKVVNENMQKAVELHEQIRIQKENTFKRNKNLKETLLFECIHTLLENCLKPELKKGYENITTTLVSGFIREQGADALLYRFRDKSLLLSEYNSLINEYMTIIKEEDEEATGPNYNISPEVKDEFDNTVLTGDAEYVSNAIRQRVNASINDFLTANAMDQSKIKEILQDTQAKIDNSDASDAVKEEYEMFGKQQIMNVRTKRTKNVLESMINSMSKDAIKNNEIKTLYCNESGKLEIDRIVEHCMVVYTFLEMVNSTKMADIDENYITEFIKM